MSGDEIHEKIPGSSIPPTSIDKPKEKEERRLSHSDQQVAKFVGLLLTSAAAITAGAFLGEGGEAGEADASHLLITGGSVGLVGTGATFASSRMRTPSGRAMKKKGKGKKGAKEIELEPLPIRTQQKTEKRVAPEKSSPKKQVLDELDKGRKELRPKSYEDERYLMHKPLQKEKLESAASHLQSSKEKTAVLEKVTSEFVALTQDSEKVDFQALKEFGKRLEIETSSLSNANEIHQTFHEYVIALHLDKAEALLKQGKSSEAGKHMGIAYRTLLRYSRLISSSQYDRLNEITKKNPTLKLDALLTDALKEEEREEALEARKEREKERGEWQKDVDAMLDLFESKPEEAHPEVQKALEVRQAKKVSENVEESGLFKAMDDISDDAKLAARITAEKAEARKLAEQLESKTPTKAAEQLKAEESKPTKAKVVIPPDTKVVEQREKSEHEDGKPEVKPQAAKPKGQVESLRSRFEKPTSEDKVKPSPPQRAPQKGNVGKIAAQYEERGRARQEGLDKIHPQKNKGKITGM